jgi:hypothetical protein
MLNVDSRFAAFVMAIDGRHLSAAPNASRLLSSAEDVFGAVIASVKMSAIESICLNQDAVGPRLSSVIPKRSTSDDVKGVPRGTSEMSRTYASSCALSIAIKPRPSRKCKTCAERRRGQRPQAVRNARSERSEER